MKPGFAAKNRFGLAVLCTCIVVSAGLIKPSPVRGDMGAIHLARKNVSISEPAQKAVIMHNGSEEILILETDLKASAKTDIVRFIPFPAKPRVSLAPENTLQKMGELVQAKKLHFVVVYQTKGGGGLKSRPSAEIVSRTRLGAHDVAVVKINDVGHFTRWVRNRFKSRKNLLTGPELERVGKVAADYVKDGIDYFVFDFVTVRTAGETVAPVAFRFKSKKVYYPLRTSNTIGGEGKVQLFFLAIDCVRQPFNNELLMNTAGSKGRPVSFYFSNIEKVSPEEADAVYPGAAAFFEEEPIVLQAAEYSGPLNFSADLNSFMLTYYDPRLYLPNGEVPKPAMGPPQFASVWKWRRPAFKDPIGNAELLENQRRLMTGLLVDGSFYLDSAHGKVRFKDALSRGSATRVEINRIAFGDLNSDIFQDAAVITEASGKPDACELTVFTGSPVEPSENPKLERAASVILDSCDVQDFSIANRAVKITAKGGASESYMLSGGKLVPVK